MNSDLQVMVFFLSLKKVPIMILQQNEGLVQNYGNVLHKIR